MTPAIKGILLAVSSSLAVSIVAKVTVITALALFAAWLARGSRAAVRHALLAAAFGVTLLLPIASIVVPPVRLGVSVVVENRVPAVPPLASGVEQIPPVLITDDPGDPVISVSRSSRISLSNLLLAGWVAGGAIFLLPLVIGLWQIRLLRQSGLPWRHGQSLAETIALDSGVRRRVEVLLHETVPGPMTCGIVHPTIVLPRDAKSWNEEDLKRALLHELEHVRRGDSVSRCFARGACAVYWFHPLVWIAQRRLVLEAERACDDAVLRRSEATAYADQLVGLAKRLSAAQRSPLLAMANRAELASRVRAVLDAQQRRGRAGALSLGLAITAAVLVLSMSSLILVATPQTAPAQTVTPPAFDTVQGEPSHEKPDPLRPVAQPQPPAVTPAVVNPPPSQLLAQQIDPQQSSTRPAAQSTAASTPLEFEVVSVKPIDPGSACCSPPQIDPGRFVYKNSLYNLIGQAYRALFTCATKNDSGDCVFPGAPPWIYKDRFEIEAKIPEGVPAYSRKQFMGGRAPQLNQMLQSLLEDRFKLKVHWESRTVPIYALTVGKNGPKLKPAEVPPGNASMFLSRRQPNGNIVSTFPFRDASMQDFTESFGDFMDRPVLDRTGLKGNFDFTLEWESEPDEPSSSGPGFLASRIHTGPAMFKAIEEELGLKLQPTKGPVEVLVIDHVEEPAAN